MSPGAPADRSWGRTAALASAPVAFGRAPVVL